MTVKSENQAGKSNIYLFCGEDSFSAFEKAQLWKEKFLEKYGDLNCLVYRGTDLTASEFQTALESFPFLSEKKLVFVSDFLKEGNDDDQKAVAEMLKNVPDYAVILFWEHHKPDARTALYKRLVALGNVENYELKNSTTLIRWIVERFQKKGVRVGETEARFLGEMVGNNLWNVSNEIEKLVLYAGGKAGQPGRAIDRAMIEKVASPNPSASIFKFTDLLGERRLREAMGVLEVLVESGEETVAMFYMLIRHFRLMAQVKDMADRGSKPAEIAKTIKEAPFVVSKIYAQVKTFDAAMLRKIYEELLAIDSGFKTGRIRITTHDNSELVRELEVFVTKVCI